MNATKPAQQSHEGLRHEGEYDGDLDRRYGKIGISAVAAAARCKGGQPRKVEPPREPFDRD
jgi:hypothetical protein